MREERNNKKRMEGTNEGRKKEKKWENKKGRVQEK